MKKRPGNPGGNSAWTICGDFYWPGRRFEGGRSRDAMKPETRPWEKESRTETAGMTMLSILMYTLESV